MIKDVLRYLDYSSTAQISLLMFFAIFVIVTVRTLLQNRQLSDQHSRVIFDDDMKENEV